jgi:hypothetical protein
MRPIYPSRFRSLNCGAHLQRRIIAITVRSTWNKWHHLHGRRPRKRLQIASEMSDHQLKHIHWQRVQDGRRAVVTTYQLPHHCTEFDWEQVVLLTRPVWQL